MQCQHQNVHALDLGAHVSGIRVATQRGPDSRHPVGGNRCAHRSAADDDAALGVVPQHRERHLLGIIGAALPLHRRRSIRHLMSGSNQFRGSRCLASCPASSEAIAICTLLSSISFLNVVRRNSSNAVGPYRRTSFRNLKYCATCIVGRRPRNQRWVLATNLDFTRHDDLAQKEKAPRAYGGS